MTRLVTTFTLSLICFLLTPFAARAVTIPSGTSLLVRTVDRLSSNDAAGKSFAARLDSNLVVKGKVVIPAGSKVYGRIESSESAGRAFGQAAGALIGFAAGGPAVGAATGLIGEGKSVDAPAGTLFEFRLTRPVSV